jgi:hypothetical protein
MTTDEPDRHDPVPHPDRPDPWATGDTALVALRHDLADLRAELDRRLDVVERHFSYVDRRFADANHRVAAGERRLAAAVDAVGTHVDTAVGRSSRHQLTALAATQLGQLAVLALLLALP